MGDAKRQGPPFRINMDATGPGIRRMESGCGVSWQGRRDALIEAGIALPEWFCDGTERDQYGRTKRKKRIEVDGREVQTEQRGKGDLFCVVIPYTEHEQAEKEREGQEKVKAKTPQGYKDKVLSMAEVAFGVLIVRAADDPDFMIAERDYQALVQLRSQFVATLANAAVVRRGVAPNGRLRLVVDNA